MGGYARSVSGAAHDDEAARTHFYWSIEHRHQHVKRELETRERRDDLNKCLRGRRARRRARPSEEAVDGRASRVAHRRIAGLRRRQRGLIEGGCLHHHWSIEVLIRVVAVADDGRDGASQDAQRQARFNPILAQVALAILRALWRPPFSPALSPVFSSLRPINLCCPLPSLPNVVCHIRQCGRILDRAKGEGKGKR